MARPPLELPPHARKLLEQVEELENRAQDARQNLKRDLADIRAAALAERAAVEKEVAKQRAAADKEITASRTEGEKEVAAWRRAAQREIDQIRQNAEASAKDVSRRLTADRERLSQDQAALTTLLRSRSDGNELIADLWADYEQARAKLDAASLERKPHPARSAAKEVRAKGEQLARTRRELKRAQWVLALYEFHFPWLTDLRELEEEISYVQGVTDLDQTDLAHNETARDRAQGFLSLEEYRALPEVDRNQLALERYLRSRKTRWQLGRDYERFIGYTREMEGARVTYQGIFAGLEDLGRDLLAVTDGVIEVIQCKRWAKHKIIHEKHVFQLFGTVVAARIEYPDYTVTGTFTTTTVLSDRARKFAKELGIRLQERLPLSDYPRIKCNVSRSGERIYHLPFDQQYDTTVIDRGRGELWASTTAEAETLGFRRAWRWHGNIAAQPA
jgi:hypothetical protein